MLGTLFRIVLFAEDAGIAEAAADAAFERVGTLDAILSDYDAQSELSQLSASTTLAAHPNALPVSSELFAVLECGQTIAHQTDGAFDITVGSYVQLWRRATRQERLPRQADLDFASTVVGYKGIQLHRDTRSVTLGMANMRLDLGGIAKGFILDEANVVLESHGIHSALLDAGGDLLASGPPPGQSAWQVEIDSGASSARTRLPLVHGALATSGDAFQYVVIDGVRYSHIIDPRTGIGLLGSPAASVHAPTAMVADAWASALCVLGPDDGLRMIENELGVEGRYVGGLGLASSSGFGANE